MNITFEADSKRGIDNLINEDYTYYKQILPDVTLVILTDGMGGLCYGDIAAKLAASCIIDYVKANYKSGILVERLIIEAIERANSNINSECYSRHSKMGTSIALLLILPSDTYYVNLGNVRIYANLGNKIEIISQDHVVLDFYLTKCLNGKPFPTDNTVGKISNDAINCIILCTDGLYKNLSAEDIANPYIPNECAIHDDASYIKITFNTHVCR